MTKEIRFAVLGGALLCAAAFLLLFIFSACTRTPDPGVAAPDSVNHDKELGAKRTSLVCIEGHEYYEFYSRNDNGGVYCYAPKFNDDGKPVSCVMEETKR